MSPSERQMTPDPLARPLVRTSTVFSRSPPTTSARSLVSGCGRSTTSILPPSGWALGKGDRHVERRTGAEERDGDRGARSPSGDGGLHVAEIVQGGAFESHQHVAENQA